MIEKFHAGGRAARHPSHHGFIKFAVEVASLRTWRRTLFNYSESMTPLNGTNEQKFLNHHL